MLSAQLTKLRILQERAERELRAAEKVRDKLVEEANLPVYEKRLIWEKLWLAYLDEAERSGLCRLCLKPLDKNNPDTHDWTGHTAFA